VCGIPEKVADANQYAAEHGWGMTMSRNPNRMQEATDRLMEKFQQTAAVVISYTNGSTVITGIEATVGRTPFEVMDGAVLIAYESRDYLITKADLVSGGTQLTPASGDKITEADGRVYVVSVPKPNYVYESVGPAGTVFKIHTKGLT
jgi:hypothetical protein